MLDTTILDAALAHVRKTWPGLSPACGLILGSGWSPVAEAFAAQAVMPYEEIPGLGKTGVAGHAGRLIWASHAGLETLIFQGRRHWYEGVGWTPIALPLYLLRRLGADRVLLTNAAGGLRPDLPPGSLLRITDHINALGANPLQGPHDPFWGPRFPDQSQVYDLQLAAALERAAAACQVPLAAGVYLASSGPMYETPAEIRAFGVLGADAVGMSTVPEALLASACGLRVAGLSCLTNWAAGISKQPLAHEDVTATAQDAMPRLQRLILAYWEELAHAQ